MCKIVLEILDYIDELNNNIDVSEEAIYHLRDAVDMTRDDLYKKDLRSDIWAESRVMEAMKDTRDRLLDMVRGKT